MASANDIDAGDLKHRITIYAQSTTPNAVGERSTYTQVVTCWAAVHTASMSTPTTPNTGKQVSQVSKVITVRYQPVTISAGMRVSLGGVNYTIQGVDNVDGLNKWLRLQVSAEKR